MQILILEREQFVQHKKNIGIIMYTSLANPIVNLFTGEQHYTVKRNELESPDMNDLNNTLHDNHELRELALDNNFIEVHHRDPISEYINYVSSYNN
jgi:hypothetical protein|tara:strand:- start:120 stop:407 length:288 start_codon:yes stop_codon:yes gene_type:complete